MALVEILPNYMGPVFSDIDQILATSDAEVEIRFKHAAPFLLEALEARITKPGSSTVGTGPYIAVGAGAPNEMQANKDYYLGAPVIDRIVVSVYPNTRSAWADMLRDRIDVLYEVGVDALDSLTGTARASVFTHVRHYQHVLVFNTTNGPLRSREVRRALNQAIDRADLIQSAFGGRAVASSGLVWPEHWAHRPDLPQFTFNPKGAANVLARLGNGQPVRFRCLVRTDLERVALVIQRQLEAVGVEMAVQEAPLDEILEAMSKSDFDAVLSEVVGGPNLFRPYLLWHSGGPFQPSDLGTPELDKALDKVRYARNDAEYRAAVEGLQETIVDDPPAIFLAWGERARAVNRRFDVAAEPNRDILTTLRLWRPASGSQYAGRN